VKPSPVNAVLVIKFTLLLKLENRSWVAYLGPWVKMTIAFRSLIMKSETISNLFGKSGLTHEP
jgi:hypothetical protein